MAAMTDVQRAGRVGGDKLQQYFWRLFRSLPSINLALVKNGANLTMVSGRA